LDSPPCPQKQVFLSHSSTDAKIVERLRAALEKEGEPCWIAGRDIGPGRDWIKEIQAALDACDAVILIWTPAAEESDYVERELALAQDRKKLVVPIQFPSTTRSSRIGFRVANLQRISTDYKHYPKVVPKIVETLRRLRSPSLPQPDAPPPASSRSCTRKCMIIWATIGFVLLVGLGIWLKSRAGPQGTEAKVPEAKAAEVLTKTASWTDEKPLVIGIYPSDGFGTLRRLGLHAFLDNHESELSLVDLSILNTQEMKQGKIESVLSQLGELLAKENVLTVVGPPITESTRPIIETIAKSGRKIPVFLECAGPPMAIGWEDFQHQLPIFRLHSGIDSRSRNISDFIEAAIGHQVQVTFLVEHQIPGQPVPFGDLFLAEIHARMNHWDEYVKAGTVRVIPFQAGTIEADFATLRPFFSKKGVVLLLGIGSQYKTIADRFYRLDKEDNSSRAQFGSWMTAYAISRDVAKYRTDRIFEITDLDIQSTDVPAKDAPIFERAFGAVTPALRDQAFSFDAGLCIRVAYNTARQRLLSGAPGVHAYPRIDDAFLNEFVDELRKNKVAGVTGEIDLNKAGNLENTTKMFYCRYDQQLSRWVAVNYLDIIKAASTGNE
jgi:hypothetical protein